VTFWKVSLPNHIYSNFWHLVRCQNSAQFWILIELYWILIAEWAHLISQTTEYPIPISLTCLKLHWISLVSIHIWCSMWKELRVFENFVQVTPITSQYVMPPAYWSWSNFNVQNLDFIYACVRLKTISLLIEHTLLQESGVRPSYSGKKWQDGDSRTQLRYKSRITNANDTHQNLTRVCNYQLLPDDAMSQTWLISQLILDGPHSWNMLSRCNRWWFVQPKARRKTYRLFQSKTELHRVKGRPWMKRTTMWGLEDRSWKSCVWLDGGSWNEMHQML
jgi:hypothetical protein